MSPQSINSTEVEVSLTVGQDITIPIIIVANPKPDISWEIGSENIHEGGKDSTQRFEVPPIVSLVSILLSSFRKFDAKLIHSHCLEFASFI